LYGEVQHWIDGVKNTVTYLPASGDPAATRAYFYSIQDYLTQIAVTLQQYMEVERHRYNPIFRSSERVSKSAKTAIGKALEAATLFDGYQKKPHNYKQPKSRSMLESVINRLINFRDAVLPPLPL